MPDAAYLATQRGATPAVPALLVTERRRAGRRAGEMASMGGHRDPHCLPYLLKCPWEDYAHKGGFEMGPFRTVLWMPMAALLLLPAAPRAQVPDHLKCYKVKESAKKAVYTADLGGLAAGQAELTVSSGGWSKHPSTDTGRAPPSASGTLRLMPPVAAPKGGAGGPTQTRARRAACPSPTLTHFATVAAGRTAACRYDG